MRKVVVLLILILQGACSLQPPVSTDQNAGLEALLRAEQWEFKGRIAVKAEDPTQQEQIAGGQFALNWNQQDDLSRVRLSGPFGAGAWELLWGPEQVTASDAKGERTIRYTGPEATENFMRAELGWVFPADSISFWLRGVAAPDTAADETFDEAGRLTLIRQQDWEVNYDRYGTFDGLLLPARMTIRGKGVRLRLVITRWDLGVSPG